MLITLLKVGPQFTRDLCAVCSHLRVISVISAHFKDLFYMNFAVSRNTSSYIYFVSIAIPIMGFTFCIKKLTVYDIVTSVLQTS